jgi:adenosylhomocysteine nucleosidase
MSISDLVERAFTYRGYVTIAGRDGASRIGFVYDRGPTHLEMYDESGTERIRIELDDIDDIEFTGDDASARAQRAWEKRRGGLESKHTPAWGDLEERPVLLVVALPIELRGVAAVIAGDAHGSVVRGRLGGMRAVARAIGLGGGAAQVIAAERPRMVICCGLAGALRPSLVPGSLVLASAVRDESGDTVVANEALLRATKHALVDHAPVTEGELLSATRVAATRDEKRGLAGPGRIAVDLESWAAARAAARAQVPWLALRVVVDPLDADLPAFARERHAGYLLPAVRHALRGPRAMLELVRLGFRADTAIRALQQALLHLAPTLSRLGGQE